VSIQAKQDIKSYQGYQGWKCKPPSNRPHGLKAEALLKNQGYQG
jgi:hypothetical protein